MVIRLNYLFTLVISVTLMGCSQRQPVTELIETTITVSQTVDRTETITSTTVLEMEPYYFKSSDPNMITIHGVLLVMDPTVMLPDPNDGIFLVPISGGEGITTIPSFEMGDVKQADVDERTGEFVFVNVQPGKYAVVVLTTGGAQVPARVYDSGNLAIFDVDDSHRNTVFELEKLRLP